MLARAPRADSGPIRQQLEGFLVEHVAGPPRLRLRQEGRPALDRFQQRAAALEAGRIDPRREAQDLRAEVRAGHVAADEDQIVALIEFAALHNLILRFIEMMPVSTTDVLTEKNFLPVAEAKRVIEAHYGNLMPEPTFRTNGPATYYQIPGRKQRVGFIGAMTNLHFCESCNKLRLTCDGKLRPCLGSYLEFDIMRPVRRGATDAELRQFFLNVVDRKPQQHDFRENYQPNRKMIAIGG